MIEIMISSSVLIVAVSLLSFLLRGRISPHLRYGMWGLVAIRLTVPWIYPLQMLFAAWKSRFSVMNAAEAVHGQVIAGTVLEPLADNVVSGRVYQFGPEELSGDFAANAIQKAAGIDWQLWIMVIWVLGSMILFGYMFWVNLRFQKKLRSVRKPYQGKMPVFVNRPVYVAEGLFSPCFVGNRHEEAIYLPAFIAEDEEKTRHALAHEMGHVLHSDKLWGMVRCGLLCFYWLNPFVWLAAVLSRRDCEISCDEAAVGLLGEAERFAYGKTLVDLIAARDQGQGLFSIATTMAAGKATVRERIQLLVKHPKTTGMMCILVAAVTAVLVACTFSGGSEHSLAPEEPAVVEIRGFGDGDELVLLSESRYGNYYELILQRRDEVTGEALPVNISLRNEAEGGEIRVTAYADEAGTIRSEGMDMGFGYSANASDGYAFRVSFWNMQGAPFYRIELAEGERSVAYQYAAKDENPVEISAFRELLPGQHDTGAVIEKIQVYSNAVWILMSGKNAEEAQQFYNQNFVGLRLEGESTGQPLHLPSFGSQDGRAINLLYQFEPGTFPDIAIKEVVTGKDNAGGWSVTELDSWQFGKTVRAFSEACLSGDMDTARSYSAMQEAELENLMQTAPGKGVQLTYTRDEKEPEQKAFASYGFLAEGETDSFTYLSMEVEQIDGVWKVTSAGYEK